MSIPTVATELLTGTWVGKAVQGGGGDASEDPVPGAGV